jgi:hypothetical protein
LRIGSSVNNEEIPVAPLMSWPPMLRPLKEPPAWRALFANASQVGICTTVRSNEHKIRTVNTNLDNEDCDAQDSNEGTLFILNHPDNVEHDRAAKESNKLKQKWILSGRF